MLIRISKETWTKAVNVILRVPSLFIAEAWYRTNVQSMHSLVYPGKRKDPDETHQMILKTFYYTTILMALTMAVLPLKRLVTFYMYLVSGALICGAHYLSHLYIEAERAAITTTQHESAFENMEGVQRIAVHFAAQCFIGATVSHLINLRQWVRLPVMAYVIPLIARLFDYPVLDLYRVHNVSAMIMLLVVIFYICHHLPSMFDLLKSGINHVLLAVQLNGLTAFIVLMWFKLLLPVQFVTFWSVLFGLRLLKYWSVENHPIFAEGWIVVLLASISECCLTPISLAGLCFAVSYVAYVILAGTKMYLTGRGGFLHDNVMHQGWTEGFTMFLLSIQTKIIELKTAQRAFLMSIVLFVVCSSLIQSMYEIAEPFLLELSASQNKSISKHVRAVLLCTFLWLFPLYMTVTICKFFDLDFWLLVVISSCVLTSVQVLGSLVVYVLFIYDSVTQSPWESLDDVVYYAKGTTRVLEFIVAVFVVGYGLKESVFGEWSWINSSILLIHCYFNVWQRLQAGWKSYLLRREAVKKIESLPVATPEQLAEHDDVCPICFQDLTAARITPCNHYFHGLCLRKWLYVQESCPLCHKKIDTVQEPPDTEGKGDNAQDNPNRDRDAEPIVLQDVPRETGDQGTQAEVPPSASSFPGIGRTVGAAHQSSADNTTPAFAGHSRSSSHSTDVGHSRNSSHSTEENYIIVDSKQVQGDMEDELKARTQEAQGLQPEKSTITTAVTDDE